MFLVSEENKLCHGSAAESDVDLLSALRFCGVGGL